MRVQTEGTVRPNKSDFITVHPEIAELLFKEGFRLFVCKKRSFFVWGGGEAVRRSVKIAERRRDVQTQTREQTAAPERNSR